MLKFIYSVFIGLLFATLVGVGIAAFYPTPQAPEYPNSRPYVAPEKQSSAEIEQQNADQAKYDAEYKAYQKVAQDYSRNVSIISLAFAIGALVISIVLAKAILLIADGLLLGGFLTLIYSIILGFNTEDNIFRFIVVAIGFVVAIVVGYIKFIPQEKKKK